MLMLTINNEVCEWYFWACSFSIFVEIPNSPNNNDHNNNNNNKVNSDW